MNTRFLNIRKLGIKVLAGFALVGCFTMSSYAQVGSYSFSQSSGTFTPITGGTLIINGTSSTSLDSWTSDPITIPVINVGGNAYTTAYMTSNGLLKLGGTAPSTTLYDGIATSPGAGALHICPFNADLDKATTTAASEIRWQDVGTELVFQWKGFCRYNQTENFDFQVRINKATGVIRFEYNLNSGPGTGTSYQPQVGIASASSAGNYINRLVSTTAGSNWNNSSAGTASSSTCRFTGSSTNPRSFVSGQVYIWTPPACWVPLSLSNNTVTNYNATIKWNKPSPAPVNGYEYYVSTTNTAPAAGATPTGNTTDTFKVLTNLAPSTQYYVWVRSDCGANDKSAWTSSTSFTTLPTCVVPTSLTYVANSATNNGATIKWNPPVVLPQVGYEYYISTTNTAPTSSTIPTGTSTDSFKVITGLPPATLHYVWVRSNCGTSDKSTWTSSVSFTTLCGTPAPGATIASSSTNICAGAPVNFSLTTVPTGPGLSYQWQSSLDGVNYSNIAGATANTFFTNVSAVYYRCRVVCSGGPDTVYSSPVQLSYSNNVTATTGAQRCGAGSVTLNATPSAGATINWYDVETGGTSLGTGTSFTTPVIANTSIFYAEAAVITQGPPAVTIGAGASTGTGTAYNLTQGGYGGLKAQYIIRGSELTAAGFTAGNITSLGFELTAAGSSLGGFTIQMGNTTLNEFPSTLSLEAVANTVYATSLFTPVVGVNNFAFSSPYNWDGTSNVIISISWSNNNTSNSNSTIKYDSHSGYMSQMNRRDNQTPAFMLGITGVQSSGASTRSLNRPMFILNNQPLVCASPRSAVTATINTAPVFTITDNKTVCNNGITPLTVTSAQSSYNNVTWSPVTGLYTDAAATVPYVANTHAYTVYHKSNVIGSEEYIATAQNTTTLCGGIDTVTIQVIPPAITAVASPGVLCVSGSSVVKISPAIPQTGELYQWQSSNDNVTFTDIGSVVSTDTLATGNLTATKYFRAVVKNSDSQTCFNTTSDTVLVNTPALTSTTPASRCGLGTAVLQATANTGATVNWYAAASGGAPIATGNSFTTPVLTANTSYYVSADIISSTLATGARPAPASTSSITPSDYGLIFNANKSFTLNSVEVYNNGSAGIVTIRLVNSGGTVLQTLSSVNIPAGNGTAPVTVPLNFFVPQGVDYRLVAYSGTASLVREASIGGYPYAVGNIATITNGYISGNSSNYYYFYNWKVTQSDTCSSPRQAVAVTINPAPAFDITNDKTVCNNAVTALTVNTGSNNYDSVTWSPVTNLYTNAAATTAYVAGAHAATVYYKNGTAGTTMFTANAHNTTTHCANMDTVKIQTLPASITALATPGIVCESGTSVLNYSPAIAQTGFSQQWGQSNDNINFTDVTGANGLTYTTPAITNTQYYSVSIKNSDGAVCMSSSDTVRVLHPHITVVNSAERCGPGSVTLGATAVDGTATWYAGPTGGTALGTGATFTTPSLNTTTDYYVSVGTLTNDTFSVGNGATTSSTYPNPFYSLWSNTHNQYLITAAELSAAGLSAGKISSLAFRITSGTMTMQDFSVKMGHTNATNMSAFLAPAFTTVYTATSQTPVIGVNTLNFNTPFQWDGTSNVVIEICHGNASSSTTMSSTAVVDNTPYVSTIHVHKSTSSAGAATCTDLTTNLTTYSIRPRFTFRNEFNFCNTPTRTVVTATIKPKPAAGLTPDGAINLCEGETQTLTASGNGTYTWLRNNTIVNGQTTNTLAVTQAAPYHVVVTGSNGCTDTSAVANITIVDKPVVHLGNDTAVCANEVLQLNAGNPGATYSWNNNSTAQAIDVTTPGQYTVTVTNNFDCIAHDTINVAHLDIPVVDLGADTAICPTQPLTLNAENPGAAYLWNDGSTTQSIVVSQEGTYSVAVTNADRCRSTDTINVSFVPAIVNRGFDFEPLFNIQAGRVRFTPIDLNPNYTYSWDFGDGTTDNQAIPEHVYTASGNYVVQLNVSDGCATSLESLEIKVDLYTTVTRLNGSDIKVKIYPNPASNVLNVALESENTYINKLSIFNLTGQNIATIVPDNKNTKQQKVQLDHLASGTYLIKIETDKGAINRKFDLIK